MYSGDLPKDMLCEPSARLTAPDWRRQLGQGLQEWGIVWEMIVLSGDQ